MAKRRPRPAPQAIQSASTRLKDVTVLGEPLPLLFGALLRLQIGPESDGMVDLEARWPNAEAQAIQRAMARSERVIPGDVRTNEERDGDRFSLVIERVMEVCDAFQRFLSPSTK